MKTIFYRLHAENGIIRMIVSSLIINVFINNPFFIKGIIIILGCYICINSWSI